MATKSDDTIVSVSQEENTDDSPSISSLLQKLVDSVEKLEAANASQGTGDRPASKRTRGQIDSEDESDDEGDTRDKKTRRFKVSSPTKEFISSAFCLPKPLENATRQSLLGRFGLPDGDEARCPKLDGIIKGELHKEALDVDRKLSKMQNFLLDASGPLVYALEELNTGENPSVESISLAVQHALVLLHVGNASCHVSVERRSKALTKLNPDLKSMAEEDFSKAQPFLFGKGFELKAKERAEALQCLRKASSTTHSGQQKKFFRKDCSHQYGGSGSGNGYRQALTRTTTSAGGKVDRAKGDISRARSLDSHERSRRPCKLSVNSYQSPCFSRKFEPYSVNCAHNNTGERTPKAIEAKSKDWASCTSPPQLGEDYLRPMGIVPSNGSQARVDLNTLSKKGARNTSSRPSEGGATPDGGM